MSSDSEPADFPIHSSEAIRALREEVQRVKNIDPEEKTPTTNLILLLSQGHIEDVRERYRQTQKLDAILEQTVKTNGRVSTLEVAGATLRKDHDDLAGVVTISKKRIERAGWMWAGAVVVLGLIWTLFVYKVW